MDTTSIRRALRAICLVMTAACAAVHPSMPSGDQLATPSASAPGGPKGPEPGDVQWLSAREVFPHPPTLRLVMAVGAGDGDELSAARSAGAEVDAQGLGGATPLLWYVARENEPAVRMLLSLGADTTVFDDWGQQAPHVAATLGDPVLLRLLLESEADPGVLTPGGRSPLICAASAGAEGCVRLLVDRGVDPNQADANGLTALHFAVMGGHAECVDVLLDAGADPFAPETSGLTPFELAAHSSNPQVRGLMRLN